MSCLTEFDALRSDLLVLGGVHSNVSEGQDLFHFVLQPIKTPSKPGAVQ